MPKSRTRKNKKDPIYTQKIEIMRKQHNKDGTTTMVSTERIKVINHRRLVMPQHNPVPDKPVADGSNT